MPIPRFALLLLLLLPAALVGVSACADQERDIVTGAVAYEHEGETLEGWLALPAGEGKVPGVLLVHEWWGLGAHVKERAEALAREGYAAFALDMFGKGRLTDDPAQAGAWSGRFREDGKALGRARARAGLDQLRAHPRVDPERVAAIGFCFGGTVALELAWSGAPIRAAVSFHGHPTTPDPGEAEGVEASILVLHGADDPHVPAAMLEAFEASMRESGLDWQLVLYGGAVHSFTNPHAGDHGLPGVAYDERAARRSWRAMLDLLQERLRG